MNYHKTKGKEKSLRSFILGLFILCHDVVFNDVDGGIYIYIKMRRLSDAENYTVKQKRNFIYCQEFTI